MLYNIYRKTSKVMSYIGLAGLAMMFSPWLFNIDMMSGGAAMILVGLLLSLTGAITVVLYRKQAQRLENIFKGKDLLAHWELSEEEWQDFFPKEEEAKRSQKKVLWFIMTFFFILFSSIFFFFFENSEDAFYFLLTMGGLWLFISVLLWVVQANTKINPANKDVYIGKQGLYVNGQAHLWVGVGCRLLSVEYLEQDALLAFSYSSPAAYQSQIIEVLVPIAAKATQLKAVLAYFGIEENLDSGVSSETEEDYFETEL